MAPQCSVCNKTFARSDTLKLHVKRKHPEELKVNLRNIKCLLCDKFFARPYTLKIHVKRLHADSFKKQYPEVTYNYQCSQCNRKFSYKHHLRSHLKLHSRAESISTVQTLLQTNNKKNKICSMCKTYSTSSIDEILKHLLKCHEVKVQTEELKFSSVSEFLEWKKTVEQEYFTQFRKESSKSSKHHVLNRYVCSRSGMYRPRGHQKRHLKLQGSKKINAFCPASISLTISTDGCCHTKYVKTHVGHRQELAHMTLAKQERELLASKIAQKIPFNNILDDIRNSVVNSDLQRIHLSNRKDLFNIECAYQLAHPPTWHKNDAISVETWVNDMKEHGNCVNEDESNFDTIMQEISKNKMSSEEENKLEKRQDRLVETITFIIRSTMSLQEIESLEVIAASMTPTVAAVRESTHLTNDKSFLTTSNLHMGNIIPQRQLFSTKKKEKTQPIYKAT